MKPSWSGFCRFGHEGYLATDDGPVTDAPASFMQTGFLAALSIVSATKSAFPYAGRLITPNLAAVLIGNAHEHRRSRAIYLAMLPIEEVARRVGRPLKGPDDFTAEALLEYMARDPGNECLLLTFQGDLQEFLSGGGHWTSRARAIVRTLLDEPPNYTVARSRMEPLVIHQPRLTILTSLNPAVLPELPRAGAEVASGLLSRLLTIVPANLDGTEVGLDYIPPRIILPGQLKADNVARMATLLFERAEAAQPFVGFAPDARGIFVDWCKSHEDQIRTGRARDERFTTLQRYLPDHLIKLACLYQIDYDPESVEVTRTALEEAVRFIAVAHSAIRRFEQPEGGLALSAYDQQLLEVVGALHRATSLGDKYKTLSFSQLKRLASRIPGKDFDALLVDLSDRGIIEYTAPGKGESGRGRQCKLILDPNHVALMLTGARSAPLLQLVGGPTDAASVGPPTSSGEKRVLSGGMVPAWAREPPRATTPLPADAEPTSIYTSDEDMTAFYDSMLADKAANDGDPTT